MCYSTCTCNCLAQASAVAVFPLGRETCLPRLQLQLERSFRSTTSKRVEGGGGGCTTTITARNEGMQIQHFLKRKLRRKS